MPSSKIRVIALAVGIALCASACSVSVEEDRDDDDKIAAPVEVTQQDSKPTESPSAPDAASPSDSASAAQTQQQPAMDDDDDADDWNDIQDPSWQDAVRQTTAVKPDPTGALAVQNADSKVRVDEDVRELHVQGSDSIVVADDVQDLVVSASNVKVYAKTVGTVTFLGTDCELVWNEGPAPTLKMDGGAGNTIRQAQ